MTKHKTMTKHNVFVQSKKIHCSSLQHILVKYCTFKKGKLMTGTKKTFVLMHSIFILNIKYLYLVIIIITQLTPFLSYPPIPDILQA